MFINTVDIAVGIVTGVGYVFVVIATSFTLARYVIDGPDIDVRR